MAKSRLVDSFNYAVEGLLYVIRSQRNMRVHFLFAVFIILLGIYINLSALEIIALVITITGVLCAEVFNTAIEHTVDLISDKRSPLGRIVKDVGAGAVLLAAISAAIVGYIIFSRHLNIPFENVVVRIKQSSWHITFIAIIVVISLVIAGKVVFHSGTPFRGGMPSGHAALAFSFWTAILFCTSDDVVVILAFILAFLVARSRVISAIHNTWEALSGAVIGILATTLVFQILK